MKRSTLVFALVLLVASLGLPAAFGSTNRDGTFGSGGRLLLTSGVFASASPADIAVDSRGRIIIVGSYSLPTTVRPLVVRLDPDGTPDPTFGSNGVVELPWGSGGLLSRVAVDGADRIVVAGILYSGTGHEEMVARLLENGEPDPGFSGGGVRTFGTGEVDFLGDLALDERGRILLAGSAQFGSGEHRLTALRLTPSGTLDTSFDDDGTSGSISARTRRQARSWSTNGAGSCSAAHSSSRKAAAP